MFLISNNSKMSIVISDLNLTIEPKQALDIDLIYDRGITEKSSDLKTAINSKTIRIIQKTSTEKVVTKVIEKNSVEVQSKTIDKETLDSIKESVRQEVALSVNCANTDLINQIKDVISSLNKNSGNVYVERAEKTVPFVSDGVSEDILTKIHAKNLNKMTTNTESFLSKDKSADLDNVDDLVSDLENFDI